MENKDTPSEGFLPEGGHGGAATMATDMSLNHRLFDTMVRAWTRPTTLLQTMCRTLPEGSPTIDIELKLGDLPGDALDITSKLERGEEVSDREFQSATAAIEVAKREFEDNKAAEIVHILTSRTVPPVARDPATSTAMSAPAGAITAPFVTPRDIHGPAAEEIPVIPELDYLKRETAFKLRSLERENLEQRQSMSTLQKEMSDMKGAMFEMLTLMRAGKESSPEIRTTWQEPPRQPQGAAGPEDDDSDPNGYAKTVGDEILKQ